VIGWSLKLAICSITTATTATTASATATATTATTTTAATATIATISSSWLGLLISLFLEPLGVLSVVRFDGASLGPEIWGQVLIGAHESLESSLEEVLGSSGMTRSLSVTILDTGEGEHFLGYGSTDNTGTTRSWDKLDENGGALAGNLTWDGMDVTELVTPITSSDWHEAEFSINKGTLDGNLNFLGDLDSETDVTSHITDSDNSLETSSLTGSGLLLDGDDLHHIILKLVVGRLDKSIDDLGLLDGD